MGELLEEGPKVVEDIVETVIGREGQFGLVEGEDGPVSTTASEIYFQYLSHRT